MAGINRFSSKSSPGLIAWLGVSFLVILVDQISKIVIVNLLTFGQGIRVTSFFNLMLAYNKGAAFSFLASASGWQHYFFIVLSLVAALYILYLMKRHAGQRIFCFSLALILGGALGNLVDRLRYGHVIDFLDFFIGNWHWPTFNIADCAICIGAILFIFDELRRVHRSK